MLSIMFRIAVVFGLVAFAAAQSISSQCTSALAAVAADPSASKCLATAEFIPVISARNTSIVQPLDKWLTAMCGVPACTDDTLAAIATNVTAGCAAELKELGAPTDAPTLTKYLQAAYPVWRKIVCLKHGNTLCITETLTNVETVTGPLTPETVVTLFHDPPKTVPANILCTDCNKETFNILDKVLSDPNLKSYFQSQCGPAFVDGTTPSTITQGGA